MYDYLDYFICLGASHIFYIYFDGQRGFSNDALPKAIFFKLGKLGSGIIKINFYSLIFRLIDLECPYLHLSLESFSMLSW